MKQPFFISESDPPAKKKIMIEALRLFSQKGLCETSIRDIAKSTGYTNPALYKHFSGKDALALELFITCYRNSARSLELAINSAATYNDKIQALVESYLYTYDTYPDAVIFSTEHISKFWPNVPDTNKKRTMITLIRELILFGKSEGKVPGDINIEVSTALVAGALGQLCRLIYLGGLPGPASKYTDDLVISLKRSLS